MPVDPQIQVLIDRAAALPPMHTLSVAAARERFEGLPPLFAPPAAVGSVSEQTMPGPGGPMRLRLYRPSESRLGDPPPGPLPVLVYFHGSGFVLCSLETHDALCRNLCAGAACLVVSVDYRLAPEHKFPAAPDDCFAATRWVADHAAELGGDPRRIVVGGDSAGGNLATVTALRARDEGGPALAGQLLIYPVTDHYSGNWVSYRENAEGYGLGRDGMVWFLDHYLNTPADVEDPRASPFRAADVGRLPPALVQTAEYDTLRDEGEAYAARLAEAGVDVEVTRYAGLNHSYLQWVGHVDRAAVALAQATGWLRRVFGTA